MQIDVDLSEALKEKDPRAVERAINEIQTQLPKIFADVRVARDKRQVPGAMGVELLPILQLLVTGGPAVYLVVKEVSRIIQNRIGKTTKITFKSVGPNGETREVTIDAEALSGDDTNESLNRLLT